MSDPESPTEKTKLNVETPTDNACYTKEELLLLSDTPAWNLTRRVLLVVFWLAWLSMIGWSVMIVVNAPQCQPEPTQAWFTDSAVGRLDCSLTTEALVASVDELDHGQFTALIVDDCPTDSDEKVQDVINAAVIKRIKVITTLDATGLTEFDYGVNNGTAHDGVILKNVGVGLTLTNVPDDFDVFVQADASANIDGGAHFWFKSVEDVADAKAWLESTIGQYNATSSDDGVTKWLVDVDEPATVETLWMPEMESRASAILASVLPGGFVVSATTETEYHALANIRSQTTSLRAIAGSEIIWFEDGQGISRKFDLNTLVEAVVNFGDEQLDLSAVRGMAVGKERTLTFPQEADEMILGPNDGRIYTVSD